MAVNLGSFPKEFYSVLREDEVSSYLNKYPQLIPVLIEAYKEIKTFFPDSQLFLEVISDPSSEDAPHLTIWIDTKRHVEEAIARLHQLDEEWFFNLQDDIVEKFSINLGSR